VVLNGLVAVVVRSVAWSSFLVVGQQVPAGVGVPAWSATVLASCLLAWSGVVGGVVEQDRLVAAVHRHLAAQLQGLGFLGS
jgi:hypothetical protein